MPDELPPHLQADCAACVALCCVGPAFDADQGFGYDKPAHQPCRHLGPSNACTIHAERAERGFRACGTFDCQGAGQRVTALFQGHASRASAAQAAAMFEAYARMRVLHELLVLLFAARQHVRGAVGLQQIAALTQRVEAACTAAPPDPAPLRADVLVTLRACLSPPIRCSDAAR